MDGHQQYRKSYVDCVAWLHAVNEKLYECGDTTGDKDSIQAQLDKMQVRLSKLLNHFLTRMPTSRLPIESQTQFDLRMTLILR